MADPQYSNSPEWPERQPAGTTLTDEQGFALTDKQGFLLPDINTGQISGELRIGCRLVGRIDSDCRMSGELSNVARMTGEIK